jgi:hypothetical protein
VLLVEAGRWLEIPIEAMFLPLALESENSFAATPPVAIGSPDQLSVAACC